MITITEKSLKKLTKSELIHILSGVLEPRKVGEDLEKTWEWQHGHPNLPCWECRRIEGKLS